MLPPLMPREEPPLFVTVRSLQSLLGPHQLGPGSVRIRLFGVLVIGYILNPPNDVAVLCAVLASLLLAVAVLLGWRVYRRRRSGRRSYKLFVSSIAAFSTSLAFYAFIPVWITNDTRVLIGIVASALLILAAFLGWRFYRQRLVGRRALRLLVSFVATLVASLALFALIPFFIQVVWFFFHEDDSTGMNYGPTFETLDEELAHCDGVLRSETETGPFRYQSAPDYLAMLKRARAQERGCAAAGWVPAIPVSGVNPCVGRAPGAMLDPRHPEASVVPDSLFELGSRPDAGGYVLDERLNVMIAFLPDRRPYDGSRCWMYLQGPGPWYSGLWYSGPWVPP